MIAGMRVRKIPIFINADVTIRAIAARRKSEQYLIWQIKLFTPFILK